MSVDNGHLLTNQELGRPQPIQEATAMQITEHAECESYQYGSNLTWMTATPETAEESEADFMDNASHSNLEEESPDFILAKGHITPNNLLPGWDDEDEGLGVLARGTTLNPSGGVLASWPHLMSACKRWATKCSLYIECSTTLYLRLLLRDILQNR